MNVIECIDNLIATFEHISRNDYDKLRMSAKQISDDNVNKFIGDCPKYAYYFVFQTRQYLPLLSYNLYEYIYGFGSLIDEIYGSWIIDSNEAKSRLQDGVKQFELLNHIILLLSTQCISDAIICLFIEYCGDFHHTIIHHYFPHNASKNEFLTHLDETQSDIFNLNLKEGNGILIWNYCYVSNFIDNNTEIAGNIVSNLTDGKLLIPSSYDHTDFDEEISHLKDNGLIVNTLCEASISYHCKIADIYTKYNNKYILDIIYQFIFGQNWLSFMYELLPHYIQNVEILKYDIIQEMPTYCNYKYDESKQILYDPTVEKDELDLLHNEYKEMLQHYDDYTVAMFMKFKYWGIRNYYNYDGRETQQVCFEMFSLSNKEGKRIWDECNVYLFTKHDPNTVYEIAKQYSNVLSMYEDFIKYEAYFGFGSFYEEIVALSYCDANLLQHLCQTASQFIPLHTIDAYIRVEIGRKAPYDIIELIWNKLKWEGPPLPLDLSYFISIDSLYQHGKATIAGNSYYDNLDDYFGDDKNNENNVKKEKQYLLSSNEGASRWNGDVCLYVGRYPERVYQIAMAYSDILKIFNNYHLYESIFGSGSFYEEIHRLAYSDPDLAQKLCEEAHLERTPDYDSGGYSDRYDVDENDQYRYVKN